MSGISIIIPCYNAEAFIAEALASAMEQTYADIECVVIDDCSTDGSAGIIREAAAADQRIKPIFLEKNLGASGARNVGLEAASGEWITLLDADDLYAPDRLERLLSLAASTDADIVVDNQQVCAFPATSSTQLAFGFIPATPTAITPELFFAEAAKFGRWLSPGYMKPMLRTALVRALDLKFDLRFRTGEDFLLYADAIVGRPRMAATTFPGYIYRRREGSLSRAGGQHLRDQAYLSEVILEHHAEQLSNASVTSLRARKRLMERLAAFHDLRVAFGDRNLAGAMKVAFTQPQLLLAVAAMIRRRLAKPRTAVAN